MTCKDCIHYGICTFNLRGNEWSRCFHFKNKADVVEVVRCEECKHCELRYPAKAIGEEAIEGYYCYPNQRHVKSTDFCNYGERSEGDG